jgi:hypothetical protein
LQAIPRPPGERIRIYDGFILGEYGKELALLRIKDLSPLVDYVRDCNLAGNLTAKALAPDTLVVDREKQRGLYLSANMAVCACSSLLWRTAGHSQKHPRLS